MPKSSADAKQRSGQGSQLPVQRGLPNSTSSAKEKNTPCVVIAMTVSVMVARHAPTKINNRVQPV